LGHCSTLAVEPIEKRPFFHFLPGSKFLSVGFFGCSLSCDYCQNYKVSQEIGGKSKYYSAQDLVELALTRRVRGIAFTYNEPTLYHEYIEEVGHEIGRRSLDLKLVVKTNGFVRPWVMRNICLYADGINVDLKGGDEDYHEVCDGWLDPVLSCMEQIVEMGVHLEVSYLVLPSKIKDNAFNMRVRDFLVGVNRNIPLHLLYFYPFHNMIVKGYKPSELFRLRNMFSEELNHVYVSNHFSEESSLSRHTYCSGCSSEMIKRQRGAEVVCLNCCNINLPGIFS